MGTVRLTKLHATGNDFLVFADLDGAAPDPAAGEAAPAGGSGRTVLEAAAALCDRHRGVGADGLIVLTRPPSGPPGPVGADHPDVVMLLRNADGSPAEMSGNGIRAAAWVAHRLGLGDGRVLRVATGAGLREVDLHLDARGDVAAAEVDMGPVTFTPEAIPVAAPSACDLTVTADGTRWIGDAAGLGNPHLVVLLSASDVLAGVPLHALAAAVAGDPRFPAGVNLEVVAVPDSSGRASGGASPGAAGHGADTLVMRVWERGVGETLSCGTGACAAAAVAHRRGLVGAQVRVEVPGGSLQVTLGATARLAGPVEPIARVEVDLDRLGGVPEPDAAPRRAGGRSGGGR